MPPAFRRALTTAVVTVALVVTGGATAFAAGREATYTMNLSATAATVRAGSTTRVVVSFCVSDDLYRTRVTLSASGLPDGVTARFAPPTPRLSGRSVLTLSTAPASPAGTFALTITAITISSDPIGTSAPLSLVINGP